MIGKNIINIKINGDDPQVLLACELGKPLFLHERDAHPEMVSILERLVVVLMVMIMRKRRKMLKSFGKNKRTHFCDS